MPKLQDKVSAFSFDGLHDLSPTLDLLIGIDARRLRISLALL